MTSPIDTYMMLIMPNDYKKIWKEKMGDGRDKKVKKPTVAWRVNSEMSSLKFSEIRDTSGRVGEMRYRYIEEIGAVTLMEKFTPQKRWYKSMVSYTEEGVKNFGRPSVEFLYFYIDPWTLQRLHEVWESKK